ncbi:MAG: NPCBM/NEW2 domain-containing protein [Planctomycetota bacterium]
MRTPFTKVFSAGPVRVMLGCLFGLLLAPSSRADESTVQWRDGRQQRAELVGLAPDTVRLRIDGVERTVPAADIVAWGQLREPPRGPAWLLRGGSLVVVEDWDVAPDHIRGTSFWFTELAVEKRLVRAAILAWSTDAMAHDRELRNWLAPSAPPAPMARDHVVLESGDTVSGGVVGWDKAMGDEPRRLRVKLARGETRIAADAIRAILWSPGATAETSSAAATPMKLSSGNFAKLSGDTPATPDSDRSAKPVVVANMAVSWIFGLRDGSLLQCERFEAGESRPGANRDSTGASQWVLKLLDGVELSCDAAVLIEELVFVQPLPRGVRYLADMETSGYKHVPLLGQPWGFGRDENAAGGALRCDGRRYPKGLGMHATSRLAFSLAEPHKRLCARLGIDDAAVRRGAGTLAASSRGSVIFRVYLDRGAGKWEPAFASGIVRGGDPPVPLDLDITGAQGMALIVDAADYGDQGDLANWLDARLE